MPDPTPVELLAFIKETFDWEELKTLCFQLYVPFDDLAGQTREAKARELITYMQRVGRLPDLTAALARERPQQYRASFGFSPTPPPKPQPPTRNPRQVFISHAHQDTDFAHRLADDLRRESYTVWIAPDSIPLGERWVEAINRALRESGIFLLVSTPHAVESEWVQDETNYAIELATKRQIRFIRLDVQEAEVPPFWTVRQHVTFRPAYRAGLRQLLAALRTPVSPTRPEPAVQEIAPALERVEPATEPAAGPITKAIESKSAPTDDRAPPVETAAQPLPPAPTGAGRPGVPIWGWVAGLLALVALVIWAASAFRDRDGGGTGEATPPGTTAAAIVVEETPTTEAPTTASTAEPSAPTATPSPTPTPQVGHVRTVPLPGGSEIEQVFVPAGSFMMGSEDIGEDERPVHEVALDAFWLSRKEITNSQFAAFTAYTGHATTAEQEGGGYNFIEGERVLVEGANWLHPQGPDSDIEGLHDHPVVLVSWHDAAAYCEWVGGRLPTEAEWEYAARGLAAPVYPWGDAFEGTRLNYCDRNCPFERADQAADDGYVFTAPAGSYPEGRSWAGALDMSGNVWEWANDWYGETYYGVSEGSNPAGPASGEFKVLRGGAWDSFAADTRLAYRINDVPDARYYHVGFRCAWDYREAPPPEPGGTIAETIHVVQAGDNIFRIGLRYGFTAEELMAYNGISNPNSLYVGQQIRIPPR